MKKPARFQPARLLKLADLLMADAKRKNGVKFNMGNWGEISDPKNALSCGTQACAFGLAAISGVFKRVGLDYELSEMKRNYVDSTNFQEIEFLWKGRRTSPTPVAMELFGLTELEADTLFGGSVGPECSTYRGAEAERSVAKRIRKLVKAVQKLKPHEERDLAVYALG